MSSLSIAWLQRGELGISAAPILQVRNLCVKVGLREVLTGIDFEVFPGDHIQLIGPNGAGKSTLLNAIAGIDPARVTAGQIIFNGADITLMPTHRRAGLGITYMRQTDNLFLDLTVKENLQIALGRDGCGRFAGAFPDWAKELPDHKRAGQLSGGQKKKLAWSMSFLTGKRLFLADEPEAGVACNFKPPADKQVGYIFISHGQTNHFYANRADSDQ